MPKIKKACQKCAKKAKMGQKKINGQKALGHNATAGQNATVGVGHNATGGIAVSCLWISTCDGGAKCLKRRGAKRPKKNSCGA